MEDKQMTFEEKTKEYRDQITSLKEIDSLEVYQWLISLGKKLNENPLSKEKVLEEINELIEAVENNSNKIHEAADVFYHLIMYLEANEVKIEDVMEELNKRKK